MKLIFGSDHAGLEMRGQVAEWARAAGYDVTETGAQSTESYDYPCAADLVAKAILGHEGDRGILVCGTGIGVSIRANRYRGIRAAECTSVEMAQLARLHNDANVLCLGGRILTKEQGIAILKTFLETESDNAERHARRVEMLDDDVSSLDACDVS